MSAAQARAPRAAVALEAFEPRRHLAADALAPAPRADTLMAHHVPAAVLHGGITADPLEPNDTRQTATAVVARPLCTYPNLTVDAGDADWFRLTPDVDGELAVSIDFNHAHGDLQLALHGPAGNLLAASTSAEHGETLRYPVAADAPYHVRVWGEAGAASPAYALTIQAPIFNDGGVGDSDPPVDGWTGARPSDPTEPICFMPAVRNTRFGPVRPTGWAEPVEPASPIGDAPADDVVR